MGKTKNNKEYKIEGWVDNFNTTYERVKPNKNKYNKKKERQWKQDLNY